MILRSSPMMRRRESATGLLYSGGGPSATAGTWSPRHAVPEVKLVPDTAGAAMSGGATCVRATELTDDELEAMLYRLHRVRRRRASEAAAAGVSRHSASLLDTSTVRSGYYPHRLCRSASVGFSSPSDCLFVWSITQKRMIPKCSNLV